MPDKYSCYAELLASEQEGSSFRVRTMERSSSVAVIAPHGGWIEPGTSETAAFIAGQDFSLYCFEALLTGRRLHITSARFDEPRGLALVERSEIAIAVHGRADAGDGNTIWMGGLLLDMRDEIGACLQRAGFPVSANHHMQGKHPQNICNRGRLRAGIQLELPRSLRNRFRGDACARESFAKAVRGPLLEWERAESVSRRSGRRFGAGNA